MDILEAIRTRKSIRGFKPDPVRREILAEILEVACRAPSAMNTQPWEFFVLAGEALEAARRRNIESLQAGETVGPESAIGIFATLLRRPRRIAILPVPTAPDARSPDQHRHSNRESRRRQHDGLRSRTNHPALVTSG